MYQNRPNRHPNLDYSKSGYYFLTIGVWEMEPVFGVNRFGEIQLNEFGLIAKNNWLSIPEHFPRIHLDEFIIMPDHIHGIIYIIPQPFIATDSVDYRPIVGDASVGDAYMRHLQMRQQQNGVPKQQFIKPTNMDNPNNPSNYQPERIQMYLSKTIQQYKSSVSREIRQIGKPKFRWQRSFYDHVIRDEMSLYRIRRYIQTNPIRHFVKAAA